MNKVIDTCGRACPEPVIMTKNALASKEAAYEVLADNHAAVENVTRFATGAGYQVAVKAEGDIFRLLLTAKA